MPVSSEQLSQLSWPESQAPHPVATFNNRGCQSSKLNDTSEARSCFEKALELHYDDHDDSIHGAKITEEGGQLEIEYVVSKRNVNEKLLVEAVAFSNLGHVADKTGDFGEARHYYQKVLGLYVRIYGDPSHTTHLLVAQTLNILGALCVKEQQQHSQRGQPVGVSGSFNKDRKTLYHGALDCFTKALTIYERIYGKDGQSVDTAQTLCNLGNLSTVFGKFEKAEDYYQKALSMQQNVYGIADKSTYCGRSEEAANALASTLSNLGSICRQRKNYDQAKQYMDRALQVEKELYGTVVHINMAITLGNRGNLSYSLQEYQDATKYYEAALKIYFHINAKDPHALRRNAADMISTLTHLGNIYRRLDNPEMAGEYFEKALKVYHDQNGHTLSTGNLPMAETYHNLGLLKREAFGDAKQAKAHQMRAMQIVEENLGSEVISSRQHPLVQSIFAEFEVLGIQVVNNNAGENGTTTRVKNKGKLIKRRASKESVKRQSQSTSPWRLLVGFMSSAGMKDGE